MTFAAFDAYVDTHAQAILDRLATFCRIPSVSAENGPAMGQAADFVVDLCRTVGIHTELSPQPAGPPIIVGKAGAGEKCLMIYNHYDVQPPDPLDEWRSPPFDPQIRDGKMFARGVADNKGDVIARLTAIQAYQQTIGPLPVRLLYVIEGEEEVGSMHLFKFSRRRPAATRTPPTAASTRTRPGGSSKRLPPCARPMAGCSSTGSWRSSNRRAPRLSTW